MPKKKGGKKGKNKGPVIPDEDFQKLLLLLTKGDEKLVTEFLDEKNDGINDPVPRDTKETEALVNGMDKEGKFKGKPLDRTIQRGFYHLCEILIKRGAEVFTDHLISAIKIQSYHLVEILLQDRQTCARILHAKHSLVTSVTPAIPTPHHAALNGHAGIMALILDKDLPQNANIQIPLNADQHAGRTALHQAAEKGHVDTVMEMLLWQKLKLTRNTSEGGVPWECEFNVASDVTDGKGATPLGLAAETGQLECVKALVVEGRLAQLRCNCGRHGNARAMEAYLSIKMRLNTGLTPVQWAAYRGDYKVIEFLVGHGMVFDVDDIRASWFPKHAGDEREPDLRALMEFEFSLRLMRNISAAVYRGERTFRERKERQNKIAFYLSAQRGISESKYCSYIVMLVAAYDKAYCDEDHIEIQKLLTQEKLAKRKADRQKALADELQREAEELERIETEKQRKAAAEEKARKEAEAKASKEKKRGGKS